MKDKLFVNSLIGIVTSHRWSSLHLAVGFFSWVSTYRPASLSLPIPHHASCPLQCHQSLLLISKKSSTLMKIICCFLTALLIAPTVYCHSPDCSGTQQLYHAVGSVLHWSGVVAGALELAVVELELEGPAERLRFHQRYRRNTIRNWRCWRRCAAMICREPMWWQMSFLHL